MKRSKKITMKYTFFSLFVMLFLFACQPQGTVKIKETYPDGQLLKEIILDTTENKNDTLEKTEYYPNGNIKIKGTYKNNLRHGEWQYFYKNGQLWSKGTFINGKSNGKFIIYEEDGKLFMQSSYKNGIPDGLWVFYEKGKKKKEVLFKNDSIIKETNF